MNGTKIVGTVCAVALVIFIIAPIASAQHYYGILDGQWFKVNISAKGYRISASDYKTVLGKEAGSLSAYLLFDLEGGMYRITTCTQNDVYPDQWHKIKDTALPLTDPADLPSPRNSIWT